MSSTNKIKNNTQGRAVHDAIQTTALECASKGSHFDALWYELLEVVLSNCKVDINMDLWEATYLMLRCAGYYYDNDWRDTHPTNNYEFWYKYENDESIEIPIISCKNRNYIAFRMTIAMFETINYWCCHNRPLAIMLNSENLYNVMKNGRINFDWDSYRYER